MKKIISIISMFIIFSFIYAQDMTLAVIPDSQNYVYLVCQKQYGYPFNQSEIFYNQIEYIKKNARKNGGNIDFVIHLGDIVDRGHKIKEWDLAKDSMSLLDSSVPYLIVPGNHDYDEWIKTDGVNKIRGLKNFEKYFGESSDLALKNGFITGAYKNSVNTAYIFKSGEKKFLFLGLEIEPDDSVLSWADMVISENPDCAVVLVIHEYLSLIYEKSKPGIPSRYKNAELSENAYANSSEDLWNKFICKNKQIFLVLCGHSFLGDNGEAVRTDLNNDGYPVYQMLSNYQGRKRLFDVKKGFGIRRDCGDGWMRILNFYFDRNLIQVKTYSTELNCYEEDTDSSFIIQIDWKWEERFCEK